MTGATRLWPLPCHGGGSAWTRPCHPAREVAPGQRSFAGRRPSKPGRSRPVLVGHAEQPDEQPVGQHALLRLEAALDTLPGRTARWERPRSGGEDGAVRLHPPRRQSRHAEMGSLPATSKERGPASALRSTWRNRKRASDLHGRRRVRPNGHSVSGDPQSEPDTQELPPTPASGAQNGSPDRRLECHHGEDVGGRDAIGVRLRLGDNPVADSAADMRAVTTGGAALRHHAAPTRGKGAAPPSATSSGARTAGGSKGGREPAPRQPHCMTLGRLACRP